MYGRLLLVYIFLIFLMKFSSPRNLADCGNISKVSFCFHAEGHDGKTEPSEVQVPTTEAQTEGQTDGGHYHGEVYHPTAHSAEVALQEAQQKTDEGEVAKADLNNIEPL